MKTCVQFFALLMSFGLLFFTIERENVFALPEVAEWKTGDFSIEIKDWDNPLGIEGLDNSGLNQDTCRYKVESKNPVSGLWEATKAETSRTCADPIPITVGAITGEGYKGQTDIQVQTADCKYSGENACRITAWAEDYAGNNSFGTDSMLVKIYSISGAPPTSKITKVDTYEESTGQYREPGYRANFPTLGAYTYFLNAKDGGTTKRTWWLQVEDKDNTGGTSLLDKCYISINGVEKPSRSCNGYVSFTAGPGGDCAVEEDEPSKSQCIVRVWATDLLGNTNRDVKRAIGDIDPSLTTDFEKDQREYKNFTSHFAGFNVFRFSTDFTPPNAQ